jgi:23S rRNA (adenine2503-C2)-methyltransferase
MPTTLPLVAPWERDRVEALRRRLGLDPQVIRRVRGALFKRCRTDAELLAEIPAEVRAEFAKSIQLHCLQVDQRHDSQSDGATKLLLRTANDKLIETVVLRIATGRTSLCVSSQVGCAAACEFCATGKMGIAQNLSTAEILDQIVLAGQILAGEGRRVRNLVFMGMGEPFHNEAALFESLEALIAPDLFHHSPARILVSTVGIPDAMLRCARRFPKVNLALSLHSVRPEVRQRLIPLAARYSLLVLRDTLEQLNRIQPASTTVMIEYLMLAGINDALDDARELAAWLQGLRVHVNLIPYNPIDGAPRLRPTPRSAQEAFAAALRDRGLVTTVRYSLGADIAAACGQLVRPENRRRGSNY